MPSQRAAAKQMVAVTKEPAADKTQMEKSDCEISIVFKHGAVLGPLPASYEHADGASKIVQDFSSFVRNKGQKKYDYNLEKSRIAIDFSEVAAVSLKFFDETAVKKR